MSIFVRFTETEPTKDEVSFNGFEGTPLKGLCCFELNEDESIYLQVRRIARRNANYVTNSKGICYVFDGQKVDENFNNEGVIAKYDSTIERIELGFNSEAGYYVK